MHLTLLGTAKALALDEDVVAAAMALEAARARGLGSTVELPD